MVVKTFSDNYGLVWGSHSIANNYSWVFGGQSAATGVNSFVIGNTSVASGTRSVAIGRNVLSNGITTFAGGEGSISTNTFDRRVRASGLRAFIWSENNSSQTAGAGALADNSVILGGKNHNIDATNPRAAIIGGTGISLTGSGYTDVVAVPSLALFTTPGAGSTDDVLTWNASTKILGKVSQSSLTPSKIFYPPGSDPNPVNNDFIVGGFGTVVNECAEGACLPSGPTNGTPIQWKFLDAVGHNCGNALLDSIYGAAGEGIKILFPPVKRVIEWNFQNDETLGPLITNWGTQIHADGALVLECHQPTGISAKFQATTADGGNFVVGTSGGDAFELGTAHSFWASYSIMGFNVSSNALISAGQVTVGNGYDRVTVTYNGPQNYHAVLAAGFDEFNRCFYLVRNSDNTQVLKGDLLATDQVIISTPFIRSLNIAVDANWADENKFLENMSSVSVSMQAEAWIVGYPTVTSGSILVNWQTYSGATSYKIYRATRRGFTGGSPTLVHSANDLSFVDTGRTPGTIYYYRMYAVVSGVDTPVSYIPVVAK